MAHSKPYWLSPLLTLTLASCSDGEMPDVGPEPSSWLVQGAGTGDGGDITDPDPSDVTEPTPAAPPIPTDCCVEQAVETGDVYCVCQPLAISGVPDCRAFLDLYAPGGVSDRGTWRLVNICAPATQLPMIGTEPSVWSCYQIPTGQCTCSRAQQSVASTWQSVCSDPASGWTCVDSCPAA